MRCPPSYWSPPGLRSSNWGGALSRTRSPPIGRRMAGRACTSASLSSVFTEKRSLHKASTYSCTVLLQGPQALNAADCCTRFKRTSCAAGLATKFSAAAHTQFAHGLPEWRSACNLHPRPHNCCACVSKSNKKPCHYAKVYRSVMARQMFDFALLLPYGLGSNRCFIRNQPTNTFSIPMASNASLTFHSEFLLPQCTKQVGHLMWGSVVRPDTSKTHHTSHLSILVLCLV